MTELKPPYPRSQIKLTELSTSLNNYKSGIFDEMYSSLLDRPPVIRRSNKLANDEFRRFGNFDLSDKKENKPIVKIKDLIFRQTPWVIGNW